MRSSRVAVYQAAVDEWGRLDPPQIPAPAAVRAAIMAAATAGRLAAARARRQDLEKIAIIRASAAALASSPAGADDLWRVACDAWEEAQRIVAASQGPLYRQNE